MSTEVKLELSPVTGTRDVAILGPAAKRNKSIEAAGTRRRGWSDFRQRIRFIGRFAAAFSIDYQGADSVFTSYMPRILHQQLLTYSQKGLGGYQLEFRGEGRHVKAACMFSDASGFTQLTEKLAQLPTGAETMCGIMNKYLTLMIDTISQHGGDVVKFAGDALLVVFPIDSSADAPPGTFSTALDATMQAAKCACALAKGPLPPKTTQAMFINSDTNLGSAKLLKELSWLAEGGHLSMPKIDSTFDLDQVKEGFARSASHHAVGKISIRVPPPTDEQKQAAVALWQPSSARL